MNCRDLFSVFVSSEKGSKLECQYDKKECSLNLGTKQVDCALQPNNRFDLESLIVDYAFSTKTNATFQHIAGETDDKMHSLHFDGQKGFEIKK